MDHSEILVEPFFQSITALPHEMQKEKLEEKIAHLTSQLLQIQTSTTPSATIPVPTTTPLHEHEMLNTPDIIEKALHILRKKRTELESIPTQAELEELFHHAMTLPTAVERDRALVHFFKTCCRVPDRESIKKILRSEPNFNIDASRHITFDPSQTIQPLVEVRNESFSLYTLAVEMNDRALLILLHDLGANIASLDGNGRTPLGLAMNKKDKEMVKLLHTLGADVNPTRSSANWTPLTATILFSNDLEMTKLLLELGADIHQKDGYGSTPLICAKNTGNQAMIQLLESKGASMDHVYPTGYTLLGEAVHEKQYERIQALIALGANINGIDADGYTPLTSAVDRNDEETIRTLLYAGANINQINKHGINPLSLAIHLKNQSIINLLTGEFHADQELANFLIKAQTPELAKEHSPLTLAVNTNDVRMIRALLASGADLDGINPEGYTPLCVAKLLRKQYIISLLTGEFHADQELANQLAHIKTTALQTGLYGTVSIKDKHEQDRAIPIEGGWAKFETHDLSQTVGSFLDSSPLFQEELSREARGHIQAVLDHTDQISNNPTSISTQDILSQIHRGETVAISSGWLGHWISIVFGDNKIFICNRGEGREEHAIMAYECTPANVSEGFISEIRSGRIKNAEEFKKLLQEQLGTSIPISEECLDMRPQKVGNCSWSNTKAIFQVLLYLELKRSNPQTPPHELQKEVRKIYKIWSAQVRIEATKKYAESPIDELVPEMLTKLVEKTLSSRYLTTAQKEELLKLLQQKIAQTTAFLATKKQTFPETTEIREIRESLEKHDTQQLTHLLTDAIYRNNRVLVQKIMTECDSNSFSRLSPTALQFARENNDTEMTNFIEKRARAEQERARVEQERARAEQERARAEQVRRENLPGISLGNCRPLSSTESSGRSAFIIERDQVSTRQPTTRYLESRALIERTAVASSPLSRTEKAELIENAKTLGLKLPIPAVGQNLPDCMSSDSENFFTELALTNGYATIPETHEILSALHPAPDSPLAPFVQRYNDKARALGTAWESSHAHESLIKCRKVSKRGFEKTFFKRSYDTRVGFGSFKEIFLTHIIKPSSSQATPSTTAIEKEKVKIYEQLHVTSPQTTADLIRECRIAEDLEKNGVQHIVHMRKIDSIGPSGEPIAVGAMAEYCQEGSLSDFLKKYNPIPKEVRERLAIELCTSLDDMHRKGLYVHGDLHLENVLVQRDDDGNPHIKLADFGFSSRIGTEQTESGGRYVAPEEFEQITQRRALSSSPTTDAYALGEILYALLLDRSIFEDHSICPAITREEIYKQIHTPTPELADANIEKVLQQYQDIYASATTLQEKQEPYARLFMGLFDPNPSTRWSVAQAREFITQQ